MRVLTLLCLILSGCSALVPSESTNKQMAQSTAAIQASHETELTKRINGNAVPLSISMSGSSNVVTIGVPDTSSVSTVKDSTAANSSSKSHQSADASSSIPLGVKLALLGLGLLILGLVLKGVFSYIKANSAAVSAAYSLGDQSLANVISHIESKRAAENDPRVQAQLNDLLAQVEKNRGKLNAG